LLLSIVAIVVTASLLGLGQNLNASCDSANKGFQSSGGGRADSGNPRAVTTRAMAIRVEAAKAMAIITARIRKKRIS